MIVFGQRLFGKVDVVPGHFHVATRFAHVNFIPLVPTGSWIVLAGSQQSQGLGTSWRGVQLPRLSWRSVGMAWLRFGFFVLALGGLVGGLVGLAEGGAAAGAGLAVAGVAVAGFFASYRLGRADAQRAQELCRQLQLPEEVAMQVRRAASSRR